MKPFLYLLAASICLGTAGPAWAAKMMSVQVEAGKVREKPSVFGKITSTLPYGARVKVTDKKDPWMQVETEDGAAGWVHVSMLTKKKIELKAGEEDVSRAASSEELAMAGKGFNSQVEADFKEKNQEIDFGPIDDMENINVDDEEIQAFLKEGGLGE